MTDVRSTIVGVSKLADRLGRLAVDGIGSVERLHLLKDLAGVLLRRSRNVSTMVGQAASLLEAAVSRLPVRDVEALRARYGADTEVVAERLVAEAARHAGLVWTAAAAVPAPSRVVRLIKVLVHSIIEVRLIGELYTLYGGVNASGDPAWSGMVLSAWATGRPVALSDSRFLEGRDIVAGLRARYASPDDRRGRLARVLGRGRDGAESIRRLGRRFRRRMRPDPSMWVSSPARLASGTAEAAAGVTGGLLGGPGGARFGRPDTYLDRAWWHHLRARSAVAAAVPGADQRVLSRLNTTLDLQERHLRWLAGRLRRSLPATAFLEPGAPAEEEPLVSAHAHASLADDAVDEVEEAGRRARRLAGWPVSIRNGLVYLLITVVVTLPAGLLAAGSVSRPGVTAGGLVLLAVSMCGLPLLAYGAGLLATGWLFKPWLEGRSPRSPLLGLAITAIVSVLVLVVVPAVGAALA